MIKLERELARIEPDGEGLRCGGGARLPAVAARAAALGLGGIEFGVQYPGHRRRGRADERQRLRRRARRRARLGRDRERRWRLAAQRPSELGFAYRSSALAPAEIVARARFALTPGATRVDSRDDPVDARAPPRRPAEGHPHLRLDLQEPARRAPPESCSRPRASPTSPSAGPASRRKHANFVENVGDAQHRRHPRARSPPGASASRERFGIELEPEVQLLGDVRFPW